MRTVAAPVDIACTVRGEVASADLDYARRRIGDLLRVAPDHVLFARIKLTQLPAPALPRPAVAEAGIDLNGRLVRAQVAQPTMREAVDALRDRLRVRLRRAAGDWEEIRGRRATDEAHEWRHTSPPSDRPPYFPRPGEEHQVLRRKSYALSRMDVDDAAAEMDLLDYEFHLFVERDSGAEHVVYRVGDEHRLAPAPATMTLSAAVDALAISGSPFVFFRDRDTGSGCVVYHRYDGHYGLLTPAT